MKNWYQKKWFQRSLEILPGFFAWVFILSPIPLAIFAPAILAFFLLFYAFYWLVKSLNISRHLITGFLHLRRNMKFDWLEMVKRTENIKELQKYLERRHKNKPTVQNNREMLDIQNLCGKQNKILKWEEITHLALVAVSKERLDILEPTIKAISEANYPNDKIIIVFAAEANFQDTFKKDIKVLERKYAKKFKEFRWYYHHEKVGEVRPGKGPNMTSAMRLFCEEFRGKIEPEKTIVTNLDADHIVHSEYFGRLTYLYATDPNRDRKTYQPVPLLFNNIWDVPALNRVTAASSSFWQIVEAMRSYRLRTFAAHSQTLKMLLVTDFWSVKTIVEDGHQYWRTYFAYNGDHHMVPLLLPVYQDAVLGETQWLSFKNQYLQKRRWAWGVTDFPYIIIKSIEHKEIPLFERLIQIWRHISGTLSWSTSSFILALGWIPLSLNHGFQDTVLAHNIMSYTSQMLRVAWVGIFANIWISLILLPERPKKYGAWRNILMFTQWIFSPITAIFLSAMPALESQTRLMLGKKLEFWITPKFRENQPSYRKERKG